MEILHETLQFAAKGFVIFLVIAASMAAVIALSRRGSRVWRGSRLEVVQLNERLESLSDALRFSSLGKKELKAALKARKTAERGKKERKTRVYVLDFEGDLFASRTVSLREEITAICGVASEGDEVVLRLESAGGAVPHYGFAAAQLARLKEKKLKLTVSIDRIAASGGYMMACVADSIVAAPFSIIGSIGVVAQVPNLNRLLKKLEVDFLELTAGEYKRTLTMFGEVTDKGRQKFQDQLEETHQLFKGFVKTHRPSLDVDAVSTGEYWLAKRGLELGLVDRLVTSDELLVERAREADVYGVSFHHAESWRDRLGGFVAATAERAVLAAVKRAQSLELR